jgi:hypothetical protein
MQTWQRALITTLLLFGQTTQLLGQTPIDPIDHLLIIPRPSAQTPTITPYNDVPQINDPFDGQGPMDLDAPLWDLQTAEPTPQNTHSLGLGRTALSTSTETIPFFEFADEPQTTQTSNPQSQKKTTTPQRSHTITSYGQVLWPGNIRTPADEEPPTLGSNAIADLLEPDSGPGPEPGTKKNTHSSPHTGFSFQDTPTPPNTIKGPMLPVPPFSTVVGYHTLGGGNDQEWKEQAQGLGVVRIELPKGSAGTVLALSSDTPVFWGITADQGTRVDGILLYGPNALYSTVGVRTWVKERSNVIRRPDLDRTGAETLLRQGGASTITWR